MNPLLADFCYERRQSPFLALTPGAFHFLHTSPDTHTGVAVRKLSIESLGSLNIPTGRLLLGDPFRGLQESGNVWHAVPAGQHPVILTLAQVGEDDRIAALRTAYVSVVFEPEALAQRQAEQRRAQATGRDPAVPPEALAPSFPHLPNGSFSQEEAMALTKRWVTVCTGCLALADVEAFEELMPPNRAEPERGWFERLFETGRPGSWFDALDAAAPWPRGASNHLLPDAEKEENIVLCSSGWGDGRYQVVLEHASDGRLVALHVDFQVVPFDPLRAD